MRIVYLGSGEIGLPTLAAFHAAHLEGKHELMAVVTQPDRPVGRGLTLTAGPVKAFALAAGLPVFQPEKIRRSEPIAELAALGADVFVVFAYGQILPASVLALPRVACLNVHASLLPRHRGAAPIHAAVLAGDSESGVTIMYMDAGLDTGDILLERRMRLRRRDTAGSLHDRIGAISAGPLLEALDLLAAGAAPRRAQDSVSATYAPKLERHSGRIDWTRDHRTLDRFIRGMQPWPGAFTTMPGIGGAVLKIHSALPVRRCAGAPGEIVRSTRRGVLVAAGEGGLLVREMQAEGKRRLAAAEFVRGRPLPPGSRLGTSATDLPRASED